MKNIYEKSKIKKNSTAAPIGTAETTMPAFLDGISA